MKKLIFLGLFCFQAWVLSGLSQEKPTLKLAKKMSKLSDAEKFDFFSKNFQPKNVSLPCQADLQNFLFVLKKTKSDSFSPLALNLAFFLTEFSVPKNYLLELKKYRKFKKASSITTFLHKNRLKISLAGVATSAIILVVGLARNIFKKPSLGPQLQDEQDSSEPDACALIGQKLNQV